MSMPSQSWKDSHQPEDQELVEVHGKLPAWIAALLEPVFKAFSDPRVSSAEAHGACTFVFSFSDCLTTSFMSGGCRPLGDPSHNENAALHQFQHMVEASAHVCDALEQLTELQANDISRDLPYKERCAFMLAAQDLFTESFLIDGRVKGFSTDSNPFDNETE